ncbi:MAG: hypothetical protein AAF231_09215 [Pseudomonadota bacterium]
MYGVVLWSDRQKNCAVIWCEDHRNLAFYKDDAISAPSHSILCPGDLVEFEVREQDDMRLALDPSLVAENEYPGLVDQLIEAGSSVKIGDRMKMALPGLEQDAGQVVPFPDKRDQTGANSAGTGEEDRRCG